MVREVLFHRFEGKRWQDIPPLGIKRLVAALGPLSGREIPKVFDNPVFHRLAYVWRDDHEGHHGFWQWIAERAAFPMTHTVCDTEAAGNSDCQVAGKQTGEDLSGSKVQKLHPYFPLAEKGQVKGFMQELQEKHDLPHGLKEGETIWWAHAYWKVVSIETRTKSGSLLVPEKVKITLRIRG